MDPYSNAVPILSPILVSIIQDPYSSPYIIPNTSLHNPFPHSPGRTRQKRREEAASAERRRVTGVQQQPAEEALGLLRFFRLFTAFLL